MRLRLVSGLLHIPVLCLALGVAGSAQLKPPTQLRPPALSSFSPTQAAAGATVTVTFTGSNFVARSLNLIFSPSQGITVSNLQLLSPTQITAQVQINPSAQTGSRELVLMDADHSLRASTPFTIIAAASNCPPGSVTCASPQPGIAALRSFSPLQGAQGSSVVLTFTGVNFSGPASIQFTPNSGITVQSTTVTNSSQIQAQLTIAPNASLGARNVVLVVGGKTRLAGSNTFTVVSLISHAPPMQILRVVPNQIVAGAQNVDLTLQGINFVPGVLVNFTVGAGVPAAVFANGPARYVNSTEIHVTVNALSSALPGGRDLNLQVSGQPTSVGKGMLNVLAAKIAGLPTVLKIPPITQQSFPLGIISLDAPLGTPTTVADSGTTYAVPWLDDSAVFKWHERNPGLADYYELRVYGKDGKTLVATQKITGNRVLALGGYLNVVPTYFRPDDAFLKAVLSPAMHAVYRGGVTLRAAGGTSPSAPSAAPAMPSFPPDQLNGLLSQGDLQWEVVGFHTYNQNGVASQQNPQSLSKSAQAVPPIQSQNALQNSANAPATVDIEVEISDRWPLKAPQGPNGLASCTGSAGNLQVQNISATTNDPNNYVGDRWALGGVIDLSKSPYQSKFTPQTGPPSALAKSVIEVQFDNVFVDWGDGTVVPLIAPPQTSGMGNYDPRNPQQPLALPQNYTSPMQHVYQSPNQYKIRVFQLSEVDLQHVNVAAVAASADGPTTPFMQAAVLSKQTSSGAASRGNFTQAALQSSFQSLIAQGGSTPAAQVASDAYMVYCYAVDIKPVEDLAADGPLHLVSIDDPDFGAYDVNAHLPGSKVREGVSQSEPAGKADSSAARAQISNRPGTKSAEKPTPRAEVRGAPAVAVAAICSTCDDGMDASSYIHFYGQGQVRVTWIVDGTQLPPQTPIPLGPSPQRTNLTRQDYAPPPPPTGGKIVLAAPPPMPAIIKAQAQILSPALQVQPIGNHTVMVMAEALPQPSAPNLSGAVSQALGSLVPTRLSAAAGAGNGGKQAPAGPDLADVQSLLNTLAPPPSSNLPPLKVGLLSPSNHSSAGLGAVQYINGPLQQAVAQMTSSLPDQHVASNAKVYEVVASDPKQPCKFLFPVKSGGAFEISGLQNHLTHEGSIYSGTGNLIIHLATSGTESYQQYQPIPITISKWNVPDGEHVQSGSVTISPKITLVDVPGLQGSIETLSGQAGGELDATLNVTLSDDTLLLPGEHPVSWSGVTAELHANGDWIKDGLTLPTTLIGWSAFTMQSNDVRLDLSHHDGDAAGSYCGNLAGGDWVGVRFPTLTVTPYTMNLVSTSALQPVVTDWGIVGNGLCGGLSTGPFHANLGAGSVSFTSINAAVENGQFVAQYKGMDIYVPWLDTHLKGDAALQSGGGQEASINFPFNSPPVSKTFGNFSFTASNLTFAQQQNVGWSVQANTHFTFSAENKPFAAFDQVFYFGMDGRGYFAQAASTKDVPLGGSSHLGQTPLDLVAVHLTAPPAGAEVLAAVFDTNVHLSEVMAAAPVEVNYSVNNSGTSYSTAGPTNSPFTIDVPFPSGQPSSEAKVHPVYSGTSGSEYSGTVDLSELGGPPITGEFRLGYQGGHDYWLTRVTFPLTPEGVVVIPVPPVMNLYRVQGGLGHNFPQSAFENTNSLSAATPVFDNSMLFMAGIRLGMPDQFTYTVDGDLVIKTGGQDSGARLDFHAWLLKMADSGSGDFQGLLQFAGGNFDGRLWGHLSFLDGTASVDLGNSASNAAVDMHFGPSAPWHIDAGKKEGPRIDGHLLVSDANMYVMLSDSSLALGGGESINLDVGDDSVASAYIRGDIDIGLVVTPQPHISGDASANVDAGVCVDDACVSAGVSAQVHAEALPVEMQGSASLSLPWPLGSISFSVHL